MRRCFDLARLGEGAVSPNPLVGALLEYEGRILSEGFHRRFGGPHAEVEALASLRAEDEPRLGQATMFVSLEPCSFHGKTPACSRLLIERGVRRVVVSCLDDTPRVAGQGIAQLRAAGIEVVTGVLEAEGRALTRPRQVLVTQHRPYVILKWAQSRNGMFGLAGDAQAWITQPATRRLTHRWRSEVDAILVGSRTARIDDPALTNRYFTGPSPVRVVLDRRGDLPDSLQVFDGAHPTLRVTASPGLSATGDRFEPVVLPFDADLLSRLLRELHRRELGILMVEGGSQLIRSFLATGLWDEARVLTGAGYLPSGLPAPVLEQPPLAEQPFGQDRVAIYRRGGP